MKGKAEEHENISPVNEDIAHERREWRAERIGWCVMLLILLLSAIGLLGPGPLSGKVAGTEGSALWVEYNRFERYQRPSTLDIHLQPAATGDSTVRLLFSRDFVEHVELEYIDPEPERVDVLPDHIAYVFNLPDRSRPSLITYHYRGERIGSSNARIGIDGGAEVDIGQFFYP